MTPKHLPQTCPSVVKPSPQAQPLVETDLFFFLFLITDLFLVPAVFAFSRMPNNEIVSYVPLRLASFKQRNAPPPFLKILFIWERKAKQEQNQSGEAEADSPLSKQPNVGLNPRTPEPWREP